MAIEIRPARADEHDEVGRLLVAVFAEQRPVGGDPSAAAAFEHYLEAVGDVRSRCHGAELFVATDGGRIVGTGTLHFPDRPIAYAADMTVVRWPSTWACLRLLAVAPEYRGRGVARRLVQLRVDRARELGAHAVAMHTHSPVARAMYARMGWTRAPAFDFVPAPGIVAEAFAFTLVP